MRVANWIWGGSYIMALLGAVGGCASNLMIRDWSDATLNGCLLCWIIIAGLQHQRVERLKRTAGEGRSPDYELTRDGVTTRLWVRRR